jgi:hypothetical protein
VLKAQLQHTKILQEISHHHQEEGLLEAQIKQVLGRPQESPDIVTENLTVRALPYSATELLQKAHEQNPDRRSKQASIRQQDTQVELAHKNFRPDFVSDSMCWAHHMAKDKSAAECTRECVKQGTKYALVVGKKVYTLEGREVELDKVAGMTITAKGKVSGETLTVESVALAMKMK